MGNANPEFGNCHFSSRLNCFHFRPWTMEIRLLTCTFTNDQVPLKGLDVRLIHLHFLPSAIYPCSQHSLPVVFVFLLRASINKILRVTLVPLSAPVFTCVFTCECAYCGCLCEYLCLCSACLLAVICSPRPYGGGIAFFCWHLFLGCLSCNSVVCYRHIYHRQQWPTDKQRQLCADWTSIAG